LICEVCREDANRSRTGKCRRCYQAAYRKANANQIKAYRRKYYEANRDKERAQTASYREANPELIKTWSKSYWEANKKELVAKQKAYEKANPEKRRAIKRKVNAKRRSTAEGSLNHRMSAKINKALSRGKEGRSWKDLVDFTLDQLKSHLESQFTDGMSWENMGDWHIDHKIPLAAFSFESADCPEFKRAWALDNLQPLWAIDNIRKNDKLVLFSEPADNPRPKRRRALPRRRNTA
jgi:hypothetical protein